MRGKKFVFHEQEMNVMVSLVASLDPQRYKHDEAKALIFKCKAILESGSNYWVMPG